MFHLAVKTGQFSACPVFPERLEESPARQGFFEHTEYLAIRKHLSRAVFDRYHITSEADLRHATARLADYVAAQPTTPSVVPLPRVGEGGVAR